MRTLLSLAFLALAASGAAAAPVDESLETRIPFVTSMSHIEWEAASDDSLYLRGGRGEWYFVRTANRCTRLLVARGIGLHASAGGQLDRHSAIMVQGVRCPVASIVRSEGPPKKARRKSA
jgi:ABC-type nitrate/sulfonate/bicarbonate transport system substrate-binding protein